MGLTQCLLYFAPHIIAGITFLTALYLEDVRAFKASNVFTILTYGATLSFYMRMFQAGMYVFNETKSCNQRFQDALLLPERQTTKHDPEGSSARPGYARFQNYSAVYPGSTQPSIKNLDFEIKKGSLLGVIGPVGAGKSTLMNVFLDETEDYAGKKELTRNISIAPQEAWIFEGSIRENILMGTKYDEKLYQQVTKAACLIADFNILPNGDQTLVGDKGVTLSGGQRARVGLARAIYAKADLYILDDPLAAVDPEVAAEIYEKCVQGFLKSKSRILITHQYQFLTDADNILYLDGGKQLEYGNFEKVMSYKSQFINSLRKSGENDSEKKKSAKKETLLNNKVGFQNNGCSRAPSSLHQFENLDKDSTKVEAKKETRTTGSVGITDFLYFMRACGSDVVVLGYIFTKLLTHGLVIFFELNLSAFAETGDREAQNCSSNDVLEPEIDPCTISQIENEAIFESYLWYACLVIGTFIFGIFVSIAFFQLLIVSTKNVHDIALAGLLKSPMRFFNINPPGRLLNRFAQGLS